MLAAILKKLAAIGIHILQGSGDSGVNIKAKGTKIAPKITGIRFSTLFKNFIHIEIDNSTHVDNRVVAVINPKQLNGKQRRALQHLLPELLNDVGAIVDEKNIATVESVVEALPSIRDVAKKIAPIIPQADVPLLNACIYLRLKYERGESVDGLKGQIMRVYGTRGCNFANLCSAGYLEDEFLPYYEQLVKLNPDNLTEAKIRFNTFYKTVLNELPWTEFVSGRTSAAKTANHIIEKINRNVVNGVRFLNIHALGTKNVATVKTILPSIQSQTGAEVKNTESDKQRIFVRLIIPQKNPN